MKKPDYVYDPEYWDVTIPIADLDDLVGEHDPYVPIRLSALINAPDVFAVTGGHQCSDTKWFHTEDEAKEYASNLRAKDGEN